MASVTVVFSVRSAGARAAGLTPTWAFFRRLADLVDITPQPAIVAVGGGLYKFAHDPEALGEAVGQVDAGVAVPAEADRYVDVLVADRTGYRVDPAGLDGVVVEPGLNARQALALVLAGAAGALDGAGTAFVTIHAAGGGTTRILAAADALGNRSNVQLTPPA
jgi:hypothetical protein